MLSNKGASGFGAASTAEEVTAGIALGGRTYLVTGATSGLGHETVRVLALHGGRVLAAGRSEAGVREACADIHGEVVPVACDLASAASVKGAVARARAEFGPLDGIVCNAGVMALPKLQKIRGYEAQFMTNHIGHFMLVTGLLDRLGPSGRVVMVSSGAHKMAPNGGIAFDNLSGDKGYTPWKAYGQSKLCNLLFARELAQRLPAGQTANALHPGVIVTNLGRHMPAYARFMLGVWQPLFLKSIPQGAATQCFCAAHPSLDPVTGEYFVDSNVGRSSVAGRDLALAKRLWTESERIVSEVS